MELSIALIMRRYEKSNSEKPKLFSTNMYLLAASLLPFIQDELQKLIEENNQRRKTKI
jgi:hypothetical protein